MNKRLEQLEVKKLLQEYSFLLLDEEYKQEIIEGSREEFLNKIREARGDTPPPPPPTEPQEKPQKDKIDPNTVDKSTKDKVKKLYRDIAKITHPDKSKTDEHTELYMQATMAAEGFDLFTLYEICSKLGISHSIDGEDKDILKIRINKKRDELKSIESSFIWLYVHAQTEEEKQKLIDHFVNKHGNNI
jgi:hypothetical protein